MATLTLNEVIRDYYKKQLELARLHDSEKPIGNRLPWQAAMATRELMTAAIDLVSKKKAHKKASLPSEPVVIRILTGSLPELVFCNEDIVEKLKKFVSLGGEIRAFVLTGVPSAAKEKSEELKRRLGGSANVMVTVLGSENLDSKVPHFTVVGERSYRLEDPHDPIPIGALTEVFPPVPARIVFNDPKGAKTLVTIFDDLWRWVEGMSTTDPAVGQSR